MDLRLAAWAEGEREAITDRLVEWLRIPSISAHPDRAADVRASAELCARMLTDAGLEHAEVLETAGAPAVYADWLHAGPDAPTFLIYGHHDVQPVDPLELWETPPFEPTFVDGELRGRGSVDDKGQTLYEIEALRGLLRVEGALPVNVKVLVEGEEEVGSPHFEALLEQHADRLACDGVVVSDTTMWGPDVPSTCVGMRGLVAYDVSVRTAKGDLHSGVFGGAVPNPAHLVASIAAALHDAENRVTIPGFYDRVRPLTEAEERSLAELPFDEGAWKAMAGVQRLDGEAGWSTLARLGYRPTCEVVGIGSGYQGDGIKTIVPATGNLKVTFRLVADQDPAEVDAAFRSWLAERIPDGVECTVTPEGGVAPCLTPVDHPYVGALTTAIGRVWGRDVLFTREGGSGPEEALARVLDAPVLFLGVGYPDDRFHAPNERLVMDQFWKGLLAAGELWHELAKVGRVG